MSTFLGLRCSWREWERLQLIGLDSAKLAQDTAGQAWLLNNLGISAKELGKFDEARAHLEAALAIRRRLGDRTGEAATLVNLCAAHRPTDPEKGVEYGRQAVAAVRLAGDQSSESRALNNVAACLVELERPQEAVPYFVSALTIRRAGGDPRSVGLALNNLANAHRLLFHFAEAEETYREALTIFRNSGDRYSEAQALCGIAQALEGRRQPEEARAFLRDALSIFETLGTPEADRIRKLLSEDPPSAELSA
jgi:tetratricopeptide (TPR) repeat protein